jgi:hypothetical protein
MVLSLTKEKACCFAPILTSLCVRAKPNARDPLSTAHPRITSTLTGMRGRLAKYGRIWQELTYHSWVVFYSKINLSTVSKEMGLLEAENFVDPLIKTLTTLANNREWRDIHALRRLDVS